MAIPTEKASNMENGLKVIQEVLNYASDSHQTRYKMMVWVKDSVDALLRGEEISHPPRASNITS